MVCYVKLQRNLSHGIGKSITMDRFQEENEIVCNCREFCLPSLEMSYAVTKSNDLHKFKWNAWSVKEMVVILM